MRASTDVGTETTTAPLAGLAVGVVAVTMSVGSVAFSTWLLLDPTPLEREGEFVSRLFRVLTSTSGMSGLLLGLSTLLWVHEPTRRLGRLAVAIWSVGVLVAIAAGQRGDAFGAFDLPSF